MTIDVTIRPARATDVPAIRGLVDPYAAERILLAKEWVAYYESLHDFTVAEHDGEIIGCGALHVMWADLAEVRTLAVDKRFRGTGVGGMLLRELISRARDIDITRLFCLTFEVRFFTSHGFEPITGTPVTPEVFGELLRSPDDGIAEFLDLARVKPNTLGNTRMLLDLTAQP